ncbi:hypothetical protein BJ508DRAFT_349441 [Ascobolus immersus RN42]|uniref:Uncharacterized protein n=1 Tax=Ascobolus immersus RN42 TaxID=1160509 RepID=A0A3N4I132_ASCIM|nr:hypothetical protein BJ508DRAFT_349441 [Ascobolus immersus RN42]
MDPTSTPTQAIEDLGSKSAELGDLRLTVHTLQLSENSRHNLNKTLATIRHFDHIDGITASDREAFLGHFRGFVKVLGPFDCLNVTANQRLANVGSKALLDAAGKLRVVSAMAESESQTHTTIMVDRLAVLCDLIEVLLGAYTVRQAAEEGGSETRSKGGLTESSNAERQKDKVEESGAETRRSDGLRSISNAERQREKKKSVRFAIEPKTQETKERETRAFTGIFSLPSTRKPGTTRGPWSWF